MANSTLCIYDLNVTNISNNNCYGNSNKYFCCVKYPNSNICLTSIYFNNTNKIDTLKNVYIHTESYPKTINVNNIDSQNVLVKKAPVFVYNICYCFFYSI